MNTRIAAKTRCHIQSYFSLILLLLPLLSACGSSSTSIFEQSPTPSGSKSANEPPDPQNLSQLHPLWTYTFDPGNPYKMVMADGITYVAVSYHSTYGLTAVKHGKQLWRYQTSNENDYISSMQIGVGNVYLVTRNADTSPSDDTISAINAYTGRERWHYSPHDEISQLIYAQGLLYFSTQREVYTLDAHTGKLQWSYQFSDGSNYSSFHPSLAATGASLYASLATSSYQTGTNLIALDGRTGKVQWQHSEQGDGESSMVVENGVLYREVNLRSQNQLSAFNAQTGQTIWETSVSASGADETVDMQVVGRLLYLCEVGQILALALNTGHIVWNAILEGGVSVGPVVGNGVVYVGTEMQVRERHLFSLFPSLQTREWLYALDAQSGKIIRTLQDADSSFKTEAMVVDNAHLYVLGSRGFVGSDESARGKPQLYALGI